jgi:hypothetical protein
MKRVQTLGDGSSAFTRGQVGILLSKKTFSNMIDSFSFLVQEARKQFQEFLSTIDAYVVVESRILDT